jgi:RNA polymerase sigma-70 factor (ECF subfamily)
MVSAGSDVRRGLAALAHEVVLALAPAGAPLTAAGGATPSARAARLLTEAYGLHPSPTGSGPAPARGQRHGPRDGTNREGPDRGDADRAVSSESDHAERTRLIALVELARGGDAEAFGMLYDHYQSLVYRFVYYRVGSVALAEDLTSETFFRALRSMGAFRWQGKDFGAWLMTIARNLTHDHFKAARTRLEYASEDMSLHDEAAEGPEATVLASLASRAVLGALRQLPAEQQECLVMRFLQGLSIAETAQVLGRSEGAVKQLQLRAVRNLAKLVPDSLR